MQKYPLVLVSQSKRTQNTGLPSSTLTKFSVRPESSGRTFINRQLSRDSRPRARPQPVAPTNDHSHTESNEGDENKLIVTVNDKNEGPLIDGRVFAAPCHIFLDTGAVVNIISLDFLRKVHQGVTLIEPTHYALQGVTGNQLNTIGKILLTITLTDYLWFDITATVVEKSSFPGDLLTGFETM